MFAKTLIVAAALAVSANAALTISTPAELVQCEEASFVVKGGQGTIFGYVVDPKKPCEDALLELDDFTGDLKWIPSLPVGTSIMIAIEDETGTEGFTGALTIKAGKDTSCLKSSTTSTSSSASSTSTLGTSNNKPNDNGVANAADDPLDTTGAAHRMVAIGGAAATVLFSALALAL